MVGATYQEQLRSHLAAYKVHRLGVTAAGVHLRSGLAYQHILPGDLRLLNVMEAIRAEFIDYRSTRGTHIRLHRDFHHLNSSQALTFNLFFPYLDDAAGSAVICAMFGTNGDVTKWTFEYVPDPAEGTNVDVAWRTAEGWTFCEVKLTEKSFGTSKTDAAHQQKLEQIYGPRLRELVDPALLTPETFFNHYQILRNMSLLSTHPNSRVVFLIPRLNELLHQPLDRVMKSLKPHVRGRVRVVHLEPTIDGLCGRPLPHGVFPIYASQLKEKYVDLARFGSDLIGLDDTSVPLLRALRV